MLNYASDRLAISLSLSCIFFWSSDLFFHLGHFLVSECLLHNKGWSLRCSPWQGNQSLCVVMLYVGEGSKREQPLARLSAGIQALLLLLTSKLGSFPGRWVCVCSRTLWVSLTNSPMRLGVSPTASTPTGFSVRGFRLYFPVLELWVVQSVLLPKSDLFLSVYLHTNVGPPGPPAATLPTLVLQLPPCHKSSPRRLPISASPTGLDECSFFKSLVVGLPYSSIFCQFWLFLFLNLFLSLFSLCEEAKCIYLHLYLAWKS